MVSQNTDQHNCYIPVAVVHIIFVGITSSLSASIGIIAEEKDRNTADAFLTVIQPHTSKHNKCSDSNKINTLIINNTTNEMINIFKFSQLYGSLPTKDSDDDVHDNDSSISPYTREGVAWDDTEETCTNQNIKHISLEKKSLDLRNIGRSSKNKSSLSRSTSDASIIGLAVSSSDVTIICNTMNALLGVSLFAMPWGFTQSGICGGTLLVIVIGMLSFETARILLLAQQHVFERTGHIHTYISCTLNIFQI